MPTHTAVEAYRDQAVQLFCDVFQTMLRLDVYPTEDTVQTSGGEVTSAVYFTGSWKGAVLLDCDLNLALLFASHLMPGCNPTTFDDDVRDCMGELANMVGGNLKVLLPDGVSLSMPSVVNGSRYAVCLCGSNTYLRMAFACDYGRFWITVVEVPGE
jgi:chemotaxis protein CheX